MPGARHISKTAAGPFSCRRNPTPIPNHAPCPAHMLSQERGISCRQLSLVRREQAGSESVGRQCWSKAEEWQAVLYRQGAGSGGKRDEGLGTQIKETNQEQALAVGKCGLGNGMSRCHVVKLRRQPNARPCSIT